MAPAGDVLRASIEAYPKHFFKVSTTRGLRDSSQYSLGFPCQTCSIITFCRVPLAFVLLGNILSQNPGRLPKP